MNPQKPVAALFDFDGVVMDTEGAYTWFWNHEAALWLPDACDFGLRIKGQTLTHILTEYIPKDEALQQRVVEDLYRFEAEMTFEYIPGVVAFVEALRQKDVRTAVVTSSNMDKMNGVRRSCPEIDSLFDHILTAERFVGSKPAPDGYLLGAKVFDTEVGNCVVFEDSFNGLKAGRAAGMKVVGLSTTNAEDAIAPLADEVICDFRDYSFRRMMHLLER